MLRGNVCWGFVKHAGMLRAPGVFLPDKKPSLVALTFLHTNVCLEFAPVCLGAGLGPLSLFCGEIHSGYRAISSVLKIGSLAHNSCIACWRQSTCLGLLLNCRGFQRQTVRPASPGGLFRVYQAEIIYDYTYAGCGFPGSRKNSDGTVVFCQTVLSAYTVNCFCSGRKKKCKRRFLNISCLGHRHWAWLESGWVLCSTAQGCEHRYMWGPPQSGSSWLGLIPRFNCSLFF